MDLRRPFAALPQKGFGTNRYSREPYIVQPLGVALRAPTWNTAKTRGEAT